MASIDQLLQQAVNPFDPATFKPGNFWQEEQDPALAVESIHQEALAEIEIVLDQVAKDHRTRTLLLHGDSGSGKSHLLGRLKQTLNSKAFFVYVGPWPDSEFIWRHILRQTVDSLVQTPEGQKESQLLLWLKSLSIFKKRGLLDRLLGNRKAFIRNLRETYRAGIYNANEFFGVLYDLLNPELNLLACDWLRGDDLDEDDLKVVKVKHSIDSEDAAQKTLENFGRIAGKTHPIVLCFDNLDGIPRLPDGFIDLQSLFNVNSTIHNEKLQNFLVIISIITNTWVENSKRVQPADKARVDLSVSLKPITLEQAEALWQSRLHPLHCQADSKPPTPIYPLTRQTLEQKFPGDKTRPRVALDLGRRLLLSHKTGRPVDDDPLAAFKLIWLREFQKTQQRLARIRQLSSPELNQMLQAVLVALRMEDVRPRLLPSPKYASYSLSYQTPGHSKRVGVIWTEDPNPNSFFHVMNACQKTVERDLCQTLQLIRAEKMGKSTTKGYRLYKQIFIGSSHHQITPHLDSVRDLATYYSLLNSTRSRDLVVAGKTPCPEDLEALVHDSKILDDCLLLQDLGVVSKKPDSDSKKSANDKKVRVEDELVKEFLLNFVTINGLLGLQTLIQSVISQYPQVSESQVNSLIQELYQEKKIQIVDIHAKPEEQLVCLVPNSK